MALPALATTTTSHEGVLPAQPEAGFKDEDLVSAERKAKELVIQHWSAIEAVAQKLLEQTTLNGKELDALLDSLVL